MATVASHKKLFTFFQWDGVDNSSYHREFIALVETIETYRGHGAIGITPTFVAQKLQEMHAASTCTNVASPTKDELAAAYFSVCEEFLTALFLSGANRDRYVALRNVSVSHRPYTTMRRDDRRRVSLEYLGYLR